MARYAGAVGFAVNAETPEGSGVWVDVAWERQYKGDVITKARKLDADENVNPEITLGNQISIISDQHALDNLFNIRYLVWHGGRWIVTNVEVQPPRLIFSLGGVYNGPTPGSSGSSD